MTGMITSPAMLSVGDTAKLIQEGKALSIAGVRSLLEELPQGNWIAGTSPYFMAPEGGLECQDKLYVDVLPENLTKSVMIKIYDADSLSQIIEDEPEHGFSIIAIPVFSEAHSRFAVEAPNYPGIYNKPLIGWIPGVHLDELETKVPAVYDGTTGTRHEQSAIVLHVSMPETHGAIVEHVNLFDSSREDSLTFKVDGFVQQEVYVNGELRNFAEYVKESAIDYRMPLVAQPFGARINVGVRETPDDGGPVLLYAPVFRGINYKFADSLTEDYASTFIKAVGEEHKNVIFSSNCVHNYLYSALEGVQLPVTGPVTFGEIAYQLINQTLVYLRIVEL